MNTSTKLPTHRLWLPWALAGLGIVATLWVVAAPLVRTSGYATLASLLAVAPYSAIPLPFALLGAWIVTKQRHNPLGWLMLLPSIASCMDVLANTTLPQIRGLQTNTPSPILLLGLWADMTSWVASIHPILLILLLFPTGHPLSRRWHIVTLGIIGNMLFDFVLIGIGQHLYSFDKTLRATNPIGMLSDQTVDALYTLVPFIAGILALLCVASLIIRYRRGSLRERVQIRWITYASGLLGFCFATAVITLATLGLDWGSTEPLVIAVTLPAALGLHALPIAIGIAILRHRLFDIDVIIRRTLTYSVLSAMLAAIYFGLVVALQNTLRALTGQESQLAIVASTLAIAALFFPLRSRIQVFIDRRFYRAKYNATQILTHFTHNIRDAVGLDDISHQLIDSIDATLQPEQIRLWVTQSPQPPRHL